VSCQENSSSYSNYQLWLGRSCLCWTLVNIHKEGDEPSKRQSLNSWITVSNQRLLKVGLQNPCLNMQLETGCSLHLHLNFLMPATFLDAPHRCSVHPVPWHWCAWVSSSWRSPSVRGLHLVWGGKNARFSPKWEIVPVTMTLSLQYPYKQKPFRGSFPRCGASGLWEGSLLDPCCLQTVEGERLYPTSPWTLLFSVSALRQLW